MPEPTASSPRVLVTGSAGFIGFHTASRLLQAGATVLGIDNFSDYYDVALKEARNDMLSNHPNFRVARLSIEDQSALAEAWTAFKPDVVIHLAAQAGVRFSIEQPASYIGANVIGTFNLLELARHHPVRHFLAASTSSVYGANTDMPFGETQRTATPMSLYAATKGATELMGHSYAHLFRTPMTFFRFFTVYGPWGRPDMALFKFVSAIDAGTPIEIYGEGQMKRDFTYIDDLVEAIVRLVGQPPVKGAPLGDEEVRDTLSPVAPWRVVNIAGGTSVGLMEFVEAIEAAVGKAAIRKMLPMQPGDVRETFADHRLLLALTGFRPSTTVREGVRAFVEWYRTWQPS